MALVSILTSCRIEFTISKSPKSIKAGKLLVTHSSNRSRPCKITSHYLDQLVPPFPKMKKRYQIFFFGKSGTNPFSEFTVVPLGPARPARSRLFRPPVKIQFFTINFSRIFKNHNPSKNTLIFSVKIQTNLHFWRENTN